MKKVTFLLCFCLGAISYSFAQNVPQRKITITAGYGLLTTPQIIEGISDVLTTGLTAGNIRFEDATFSGAFIGGIKFSSGNRWKYGVDVVFEEFTKKMYNKDNSQYLGDSKGQYLSVIPRVDFYWLNKNAFRMYSGIGAGVSFASQKYDNDKSNQTLFAFNVAPIGFELGTAVCLFGETSFGYNGLLNAGVRLRL